MKVNLHKRFLDALSQLASRDQDRVRTTVSQILNDSETKGLRLHKVGRSSAAAPHAPVREIPERGDRSLMVRADVRIDRQPIRAGHLQQRSHVWAPSEAVMSVSQRGPAVLRPALQRLVQLEALDHDWDTYGGLPPSARSLTMAQAIMVRMAKRFDRRGVPTEVMPIADGGIQLEWQGRSGALAVNAAPDGSWSYLLIDRGPDGRTFEERYGLGDAEAEALVATFHLAQ